MRYTTQRHQGACGHTAVAIIAELPYAQAINEVSSQVRKRMGRYQYDKWGRGHRRYVKGTCREDLVVPLANHGFRLGKTRYFKEGQGFRELKHSALIAVSWHKRKKHFPKWKVETKEGHYKGHWIVWDHETKTLYDPCIGALEPGDRHWFWYRRYCRIYYD